MQKQDFETYQKRFRDFEILSKFSETHVFRGTIRHPYISRGKVNKNYVNGPLQTNIGKVYTHFYTFGAAHTYNIIILSCIESITSCKYIVSNFFFLEWGTIIILFWYTPFCHLWIYS